MGQQEPAKFKKKSQMEQANLNEMLQNKARISINTQTGKHEFHYSQHSQGQQAYLVDNVINSSQ